MSSAPRPLGPGGNSQVDKNTKKRTKMATRQILGASPHGTLLTDDPWNDSKRKQDRPGPPGHGVERPYGKFVESSRREC